MPSAATAMNPAKYPARSPSNVVLRGYTEPVATVRGTSVTMPGGLGDSAVAGKSSHMHVPKNYRATSDSALPGSLVEPEGAPVATGTGKMRSAFPSDRTAQHIGALRHASDGSSSVESEASPPFPKATKGAAVEQSTAATVHAAAKKSSGAADTELLRTAATALPTLKSSNEPARRVKHSHRAAKQELAAAAAGVGHDNSHASSPSQQRRSPRDSSATNQPHHLASHTVLDARSDAVNNVAGANLHQQQQRTCTIEDTAHASDSMQSQPHGPSAPAIGAPEHLNGVEAPGHVSAPAEQLLMHAKAVRETSGRRVDTISANRSDRQGEGEGAVAANNDSSKLTGGSGAIGVTLQDLAGLRRTLGCSDTVKVSLPGREASTQVPSVPGSHAPHRGSLKRRDQSERLQTQLNDVVIQTDSPAEVFEESGELRRDQNSHTGQLLLQPGSLL